MADQQIRGVDKQEGVWKVSCAVASTREGLLTIRTGR